MDTVGRRESEGSCPDNRSVHCLVGTPYHQQRTGAELGHLQERSRWEGVEGGRREDTKPGALEDHPVGHRPGSPGHSGGRAPRQPCEHSLPPSSGPSILFGSP